MRRILQCISLIILATMPLSSVAAEDAGALTEQALRQLRKETAAIRTLRCAFTQTTDIPLFARPVISRGRLVYKKPDALVWEYLDPMPQGLVFNGDKGFRWEGDKSSRKPFVTGKDPVAGLVASQMLAWIRFDRAWIETEYTVRAESVSPISLILVPKRSDLAVVMTSLQLVFTKDGIARSVILRESGGGKTTIALHDIVVNAPLDAGEFQ